MLALLSLSKPPADRRGPPVVSRLYLEKHWSNVSDSSLVPIFQKKIKPECFVFCVILFAKFRNLNLKLQQKLIYFLSLFLQILNIRHYDVFHFRNTFEIRAPFINFTEPLEGGVRPDTKSLLTHDSTAQ